MTHDHPRSARQGVRTSILAVSLVIPALLAGCGGSGEAAEPVQEGFVGTVVYEARAGGPNEEGAALFNSWGPSREVATWGSKGRMRFETTGGLMEGILVARMADSAIFSLDTAARVAHPAAVESMNLDDIPADERHLMAGVLAPAQVEPTGEEGSYAGRGCRMYTIRKSIVLRAGATARACVAEDIHPRPSRYRFSWPGDSGQMAPLPLQYGITQGLPLMVEINENNTIITYRAVSVTAGEPADSLFSVPAGYTVQAQAEEP